ncbi:glycine C-acetyltransferase [Maritalea mediterranea]|uniref:2-amino-3-ketobutyrate coenzyme A ligase n=1 Tax=Maritalea mediterranea TaxID=2909667 RepID=A0ABS9ECK8_9HYPH|nr:glycine C-acetyltransferase [Maritalea mediterranea]MCF4099952.1 glycine C-acetyltransferase [Maritalea mediterranea]
MSKKLIQHTEQALAQLREEGLFKSEYGITSPQSANITVRGENGEDVPLLNMCANNYLGLADDKRLEKRAIETIEHEGFGMASVRFICGTQAIHQQLEARLSEFLGTEDAILFIACFDANAGVFEALLGPEDAIISDALNHASIIDGVRLCKAQRFRYANNDMDALEEQLKAAQDARHRLIVTDGVFSMDGIMANLPGICDLAEKYDALVMVDDSHAVGFMGPNGQGTPHHFGVEDRVHLYSGTFGKALGGAAGGYIAGAKPLVTMLRQKARPYLFSNALPPMIAAATLEALDIVEQSPDLREKLFENAKYFRAKMASLGFELVPGEHAIIPVMLKDAVLAQKFAKRMLALGVYVTAFSFPVVPKGLARIRTQMSAAHTTEDLDRAIAAFEQVGKELGVI